MDAFSMLSRPSKRVRLPPTRRDQFILLIQSTKMQGLIEKSVWVKDVVTISGAWILLERSNWEINDKHFFIMLYIYSRFEDSNPLPASDCKALFWACCQCFDVNDKKTKLFFRNMFHEGLHRLNWSCWVPLDELFVVVAEFERVMPWLPKSRDRFVVALEEEKRHALRKKLEHQETLSLAKKDGIHDEAAITPQYVHEYQPQRDMEWVFGDGEEDEESTESELTSDTESSSQSSTDTE